MLFLFIVGAFGGLWWPGIEVDAPPPGGDPWWWRILRVIIGGLSAILVAQIQPIDIATLTGIVVALGSGKIGVVVVGALLGAAKR
ncbi:MAG: hypothetical protein V4574_14740 [Pseudomonadota bacterium]